MTLRDEGASSALSVFIKSGDLLAKESWLDYRKKIYAQVREQAQLRLGAEDSELRRYRREYEAQFSKPWRVSRSAELFKTIAQSTLLALGDFHALRQSQKAHIRILRQIPRDRPLILFMECFFIKDQKWVDLFYQKKISEDTFLKKVKWHEKWGFPWDHYRGIVYWAIKQRVQIKGINSGGVQKISLAARDKAAAQVIVKAHRLQPLALKVIIFGDLHLAKSHLPKQIIQQLPELKNKMTLVFQNPEDLYFKVLAKAPENVELVRVGAKAFGLLSTPPWVKWQDYLLYLDQAFDEKIDFISDESDDDFEDSDEVTLDFTDYTAELARWLQKELGLKGLNLGSISVHSYKDHSFLNYWKKQLSKEHWKFVSDLVLTGQTFYLPELGEGYLARPSLNHAASLAMKFIHLSLGGPTPELPFVFPKAIRSHLWHEAMGYFGSKLINHRRKTDTLTDIRSRLQHPQNIGSSQQALSLALRIKTHELFEVAEGRVKPLRLNGLKGFSQEDWLLASQILGGIMGEKLYEAYRRRLVPKKWIIQKMKIDFKAVSFGSKYFEILQVIETLPVDFKSKKDIL